MRDFYYSILTWFVVLGVLALFQWVIPEPEIRYIVPQCRLSQDRKSCTITGDMQDGSGVKVKINLILTIPQ